MLRRLAALVVGTLFVLAAGAPLPALAATTVTFADPHLEAAARAALPKPAGDITDADMATLTSLEATSRSIVDLRGLEHATNLTRLDLSNNRVTDLTPLSGLTSLTTLTLDANLISDVAPLAALTNLASLDLSANKVTTITALGVLEPETVDLRNNWLDVSTGSAAKSVIEGWSAQGTAVAYLPQGRATKCVLSTTTKVIGYAAKTTIAGTLSDRAIAAGVAGSAVRLESSSNGTTFKDTGVACSTTLGGTFTFTVAPASKTYYRVRFAGADYRYVASISPTLFFIPRVYLTAPTAPTTAYRSRTFTAYAYLKPRHVAGTYPVKLLCYRWEKLRSGSRGWVLRQTVWAKASNNWSYTKVTAALTFPYSGRWRLIAYHPGDSNNSATSSSPRFLSVVDPRIEAAIRWAKSRLGSHAWDHYCLRFANTCYASGAGASVRRYPTAKQAADALHASAHPSAKAPRGTYVFYHSFHGSTDLGHVGISLGNGTMISDNGSGGVCIKPILYGLRYIGWAAPPVSPRITDWDQ